MAESSKTSNKINKKAKAEDNASASTSSAAASAVATKQSGVTTATVGEDPQDILNRLALSAQLEKDKQARIKEAKRESSRKALEDAKKASKEAIKKDTQAAINNAGNKAPSGRKKNAGK